MKILSRRKVRIAVSLLAGIILAIIVSAIEMRPGWADWVSYPILFVIGMPFGFWIVCGE